VISTARNSITCLAKTLRVMGPVRVASSRLAALMLPVVAARAEPVTLVGQVGVSAEHLGWLTGFGPQLRCIRHARLRSVQPAPLLARVARLAHSPRIVFAVRVAFCLAILGFVPAQYTPAAWLRAGLDGWVFRLERHTALDTNLRVCASSPPPFVQPCLSPNSAFSPASVTLGLR